MEVKILTKNPRKNQRENENHYQDFENLNIPIKLPKIIFSVVETFALIANKKRNELFSEFLIDELDSFFYDLDPLFRFILKKSGFLERLRVGINQYYGKERHEIKQNSKESKGIKDNYEIIDITLKLPNKLISFINTICEISNIKKENLFSFLIIARLEYIYSNPEVLYDYINGEGGIYEGLREGINKYYENKVI